MKGQLICTLGALSRASFFMVHNFNNSAYERGIVEGGKEERMENIRIETHVSVAVCGELGAAHGSCLRPVRHWGPHVVIDGVGSYQLVQTTCYPISFAIAPAVAKVAIESKDWTWAE